MPSLRHLILSAAIAGLAVSAHAAADKVDVGTPLPRFALLKPGAHHYLRYLRMPTGANQPVDIWTREIRFEERDGKPRMHIVQRLDAMFPTPVTRSIDSWFEAGTFRPLTHVRSSTTRDGGQDVEGFVFDPGGIKGMPDLAGNRHKDLVVASGEPAYNFETDVEFLQALPLAEGYEASINFYHPGGSMPPQRYTFKVSGSQSIGGPAGPVDCWVLRTDYNKPGQEATFWFAKGSQLMLRQESALPDGRVMVKTLID